MKRCGAWGAKLGPTTQKRRRTQVISHKHASSDWGRGYLRLSCCCLHWAAALRSLQTLLPPASVHDSPVSLVSFKPFLYQFPKTLLGRSFIHYKNIHASSLDAKRMGSDIDGRILYLCYINILNSRVVWLSLSEWIKHFQSWCFLIE